MRARATRAAISVRSRQRHSWKIAAWYGVPQLFGAGILYIDNCLITTDHILPSKYAIREGTICLADHALDSCNNLSILDIPASVQGVGLIPGLTKINVDPNNSAFFVDDSGILYNKSKTVREPSCTETGITTFICKRDASHTREEYTPAKRTHVQCVAANKSSYCRSGR